MKNKGFPCERYEDSISYWEANAYYNPICINDYIIWTELIGEVLFCHFAVLDNPKTTLETFKELKSILMEWFENSEAEIMMAIVKKESAGEKVCKMLKFNLIYNLKNDNIWMFEKESVWDD